MVLVALLELPEALFAQVLSDSAEALKSGNWADIALELIRVFQGTDTEI